MMFGKVILTVAKVAVGLAAAYALYKVCASDYVPEVVDCDVEVPTEDDEGDEMQSGEQDNGAVRVAQVQGSQDVGAEVPEEDGGGVMQGGEHDSCSDRVVQLQGSLDRSEEVPEEDNGDLGPDSEQVDTADRAVQVNVDKEVPAEDGNGDSVHGGEQVGSSDRAVPVHVDVEVPAEDNEGDLVHDGEQAGSSDRADSVHVGMEVPAENNRVDRGEEADDVQGEAGDEDNGGGDVAAQGVVAPPVLYNDEHNSYRIDFGYQIPCEEITSFLPGWSPRYVYGGPELGRGYFGSVQLCQDEYGSICAVKTVEFRDEFDAESRRPMIKNEVELQARCAGPHAVGAYGHWGTEYEMNLAFEYARFRAVDSHVFQGSDTKGRAMSEDRAAYVIRDVARALMRCHHRGVVHCDVKLANVLICEEGVLKLSDFGLAVQVEEDDGLTDVRSFEPQFAAPELKGGGRYGVKVDVWALGIIMYELMRGTRLWHLAICAPGRDFIPELEEMEADARDLLNKLLCEDPNHRPSAGEVLTHPWVTRNTT